MKCFKKDSGLKGDYVDCSIEGRSTALLIETNKLETDVIVKVKCTKANEAAAEFLCLRREPLKGNCNAESEEPQISSDI